jgi:hypothetical protein
VVACEVVCVMVCVTVMLLLLLPKLLLCRSCVLLINTHGGRHVVLMVSMMTAFQFRIPMAAFLRCWLEQTTA